MQMLCTSQTVDAFIMYLEKILGVETTSAKKITVDAQVSGKKTVAVAPVDLSLSAPIKEIKWVIQYSKDLRKWVKVPSASIKGI